MAVFGHFSENRFLYYGEKFLLSVGSSVPPSVLLAGYGIGPRGPWAKDRPLESSDRISEATDRRGFQRGFKSQSDRLPEKTADLKMGPHLLIWGFLYFLLHCFCKIIEGGNT